MKANRMFIAGALVIPPAGLLAWAWFAFARMRPELRSIGDFEGMHFDEPLTGNQGAT